MKLTPKKMKGTAGKFGHVRISYFLCKKFLRMIVLEHDDVEQKVIKVIKEIKDKQQIDGVVNRDWFPGSFIKSQILVTAIGRISRLLDIPIPNDCYPFYDKVKRCQLSIKEATQNIINALKKSK